VTVESNSTAASDTEESIVRFSGHLKFYKKKSRDMGVCSAEAWASSEIDWTYELNLKWDTDEQGVHVFSIDSPKGVVVKPPKQNQGQNKCADVWSSLGDILGGFLDLLTFFSRWWHVYKVFWRFDVTQCGRY